MGLIRKAMSVSIFGLIDNHPDKKRAARSTQKTGKEAKAQTRLMRKQAQRQLDQIHGRAAAAEQPPLRY